ADVARRRRELHERPAAALDEDLEAVHRGGLLRLLAGDGDLPHEADARPAKPIGLGDEVLRLVGARARREAEHEREEQPEPERPARGIEGRHGLAGTPRAVGGLGGHFGAPHENETTHAAAPRRRPGARRARPGRARRGWRRRWRARTPAPARRGRRRSGPGSRAWTRVAAAAGSRRRRWPWPAPRRARRRRRRPAPRARSPRARTSTPRRAAACRAP